MAAEHLINVCYENRTQYQQWEKPQDFHHIVEQLILTTFRACQEIQTEVELLTTRVKKPYEEHWEKIKNLLKYIKVMSKLNITVTVGDVSVVKL